MRDRRAAGLRLHLLTVLLMAVAATTLLTACTGTNGAGSPTADPPRRAFVIGSHANSAALDGRDVAVRDPATEAVAARAEVTVIPVDGAPVPQRTIRLTDRSDNDLQRENQDARYLSGLVTAIADAHPATPEASYLSALDIGCRAVSGGPAGSMVDVIGSGLSTATVRMQDGLLAPGFDLPGYVEGLAAAGALPDFGRCPRIRWAGLGQTTEPQTALDIASRGRLQEFYRSIIERGGGQVEFVERPIVAGPPRSGLPPVTPVPVGDPAPPLTPAFTDEQVGFEPDTAVLRDPARARAQLARVAQVIRSERIPVVHVIGTTSSARDDRVLSRRRAETVCRLLEEELGVPPGVLRPDGVGTHFAGFVPDRRPDGSLDESRARQNRLVLLRTDPTI